MGLRFDTTSTDALAFGSGLGTGIGPISAQWWMFLDSLSSADRWLSFGVGNGPPLLCQYFSSTDSWRVRWDDPASSLSYEGPDNLGAGGGLTGKWVCLGFSADPSLGNDLKVKLFRGGLTTLLTEETLGNSDEGAPTYDTLTGESFFIGDDGSTGRSFDGIMATMLLWDGIFLTEAEHRSHQFRPGFGTKAPTSFYHLGYQGDTTVADWSGGGNDGTEVGTLVVDNHVPLGPPFGFEAEYPFVTAAVAAGGAGAGSLMMGGVGF